MLCTSMQSQAIQNLQPIAAGEKPVANSTEAELWYGMEQAEKDIKMSPYLVRDPELNTYVRKVACKVTGDYCKDLRVYIIDAPVFNASMAPNGVMLVFTGALLRMQDEAELALVMSHEFAHFKQRHSLQQWVKAKRTTAFLATFGVLTYAGGVGIAGGIAQMVGFANMSQFTRDKEREADKIGFENAAQLGYDPQAGIRVWSRMLREEKANKRAKYSPVFASHPRTSERLADVTTAASEIKTGSFSSFHSEYQSAMRPFLDRWLEAELTRRMYDTSIQVVVDLKAVSSPESMGSYNFYLAEAYRRRNKNDDRVIAEKYYAEAVTQANSPAAAWREQGLVLRSKNDKRGAIDLLKRYLEKSPNANDRAFIQKYILDLESQK
jgi:beta-barrel assembly-enhancing protease